MHHPIDRIHIPQSLLHNMWSTGWNRNSIMGPPWRIDLMTHHSISACSYHRATSCLWYTNRGALAGTRNSLMGPPWRIDLTTHRTISEHSYNGATSCSIWVWWHVKGYLCRCVSWMSFWDSYINGSTMKDQSEDPLHHMGLVTCQRLLV